MLKRIDDIIILREADKAATEKEKTKNSIQKRIDYLKAKKDKVESFCRRSWWSSYR